MNANKKLYIIDDNRPFAESLQWALRGKEIELYSKLGVTSTCHISPSVKGGRTVLALIPVRS